MPLPLLLLLLLPLLLSSHGHGAGEAEAEGWTLYAADARSHDILATLIAGPRHALRHQVQLAPDLLGRQQPRGPLLRGLVGAGVSDVSGSSRPFEVLAATVLHISAVIVLAANHQIAAVNLQPQT